MPFVLSAGTCPIRWTCADERHLPPHVNDRKGVLHFKRRDCTTMPMNADLRTEAFALEHAALLNGAVVAPSAHARTFTAVVKDYQESNRCRRLAPRTV